MQRSVSLALSLLGLAFVVPLAGCGGGGQPVIAGPAISVSVEPAGVSIVPAGSPTTFTATVANDTGNKGVTWTVSCSASQCGQISPTATLSGMPTTYTAPASAPASDLTVTVRATSAADTSRSGSATVTVPAITVSIDPTSVTVQAGGMGVPFSANANNDPSGQGVTWTISPASGAGTLIDQLPNSVTYKPPVTPPATHLTVTITATSIADPSKSASATVSVPTEVVSVVPATATVQTGSPPQSFTATVTPDPGNKGVSWTISPASGAGTLSNMTTTSVTYNPPTDTSDLTVTITATSVADPLASTSATIAIPAITVSVSPASALIPVDASSQFNATPFTAMVSNDPSNTSANWTITQGGIPCSTCGSVSLSSTQSGTPTIYSAPPTVPANATVTLTATSAADVTRTADATITLTVGTVKLIPASLSFGIVPLGQFRAQSATLTNTGSTALNITGIAITGDTVDFTQTHNCGTSVAAGKSCTINVTFKPKTAGPHHANLSISDDSAGSPQIVSLSGKGRSLIFSDAAVRSAISKNRSATVPSPTGPSKVGTSVMDLIDSSRNDPYLGNGTKRELLVRFWYPAARSQGCRRAEYTSPKVWSHLSRLAGMSLPEVRTNSCLDAPMIKGMHPVIVFTHGYTGTFTDYTFLFEDLASRGYVVASIDHTYETTAVEFLDGRFVEPVFGSHLGNTLRGDGQAMEFAVSARLGDLKFVVDELERLNARPESPFVGKLDMSNVALAGHSLGGLTALLGIEQEPRFRAGIFIDGVVPDTFNETEKPVFILTAGREHRSNQECRLWDNLRGPRFAVNLKGADHVTPSDLVWLAKGAIKTGTMGPEKTVAAIRDYIAAFLDTNLRSEPVGPLLTGPSVEYPDAAVTTRSQSLCGGP